MDQSKSRSAFAIALVYLVIVGLWFIDGGALLRRLFEEGYRLPREMTIAADLLVCFVTATLLYTLMQREIVQRERAAAAARRAEELEIRVLERTAELAKANRGLEQRVEERTMELSTLLQISHDVSSTLELQPLLDTILDRLSLMVEYTGASVIVRESDGIRYLAYRGPRPQQEVMGLFVPLTEAPILTQVITQRQPVIVADLLDESPLSRAYRELTSEQVKRSIEGSRSLMGIPLLVRDQVIGVIRIEHHDSGHFTLHDAELALTIAGQAAIAIENSRLYEEAQKVAALEERQRLARELHDSVAQTIYGIGLGAHAAQEMLAQNSGETAATLAYVINLAQAANVEMRSLILELRPEYLENEGLHAALERQVAATKARYGLEVQADLCAEPSIPLESKEVLYRVAQEALYNTGRHAKAGRATLSLSECPDGYELDVTDDGVGFDPSQSFPGHLGLQSMRERVARLGGTLEIESAPGQGTHIHAMVPANRD